MVGNVSEQGRLFVITGIPGAGKTTVGRALAKALPKAVFVDGDLIGDTVVSGKEVISEPPSIEAIEQLLLRYAGALTLADVYRSAGFDAVIADDIIGDRLDDFLELAEPEPVHLVVLHPSADVVGERSPVRDQSIPDDGLTTLDHWNVLEHQTGRLGLWLDTSTMSNAMAVTTILRDLDQALIVADTD